MKSKKATKKKAVIKKQAPVKTAPKSVPLSRHVIPKVKGDIMRQRFTDSMGNPGSIKFQPALEFDALLFVQLLQLKDACKVRIHNALNDYNEHTFVVTTVNSNGFEIYFKLKPQKAPSVQSLKTAAAPAQTTPPPDNDGVGNMADQCSDPSYRKI